MTADHSTPSSETADVDSVSEQDAGQTADALLEVAADIALVVEDLGDRDNRLNTLERELEAIEQRDVREHEATLRELRIRRAAEQRLQRELAETERELR